VLDGNTDSALTRIDTSVMTQPWEQAVAACLRSYAHLKAEQLDAEDLAAMLTAVQLTWQSSDRPTTLFRIRLGLTAVDLTTGVHQDEADLMSVELIEEVERSADAFAAREALGHPACRTQMTSAQTGALAALVDRARLGAGSIPEALLNDLMASVQTTGTVLVLQGQIPGRDVGESGISAGREALDQASVPVVLAQTLGVAKGQGLG